MADELVPVEVDQPPLKAFSWPCERPSAGRYGARPSNGPARRFN